MTTVAHRILISPCCAFLSPLTSATLLCLMSFLHAGHPLSLHLNKRYIYWKTVILNTNSCTAGFQAVISGWGYLASGDPNRPQVMQKVENVERYNLYWIYVKFLSTFRRKLASSQGPLAIARHHITESSLLRWYVQDLWLEASTLARQPKR